MKKMIVVLLVFAMVFVMVGGVVAAYEHGGIKHGGLGYWRNYDFAEDWLTRCPLELPPKIVIDILSEPPRGCAVRILERHHLVAFLNWSENWALDFDSEGNPIIIDNNPMPEHVAAAFWAATNDLMPPSENDPGYEEWKPSPRWQLLEWKDILEAWNEGK